MQTGRWDLNLEEDLQQRTILMDILQISRNIMIPIILALSKPFTKSEQTGEAGHCSTGGFTVEDDDRWSFLLLKIISLLFILFFFSVTGDKLSAQRKADVGIFAGTSYYLGDLNPSKHFYSSQIAIGPVYRYNFHPRSSVRLSGIYHRLTASDLDFNHPYQLNRGAAFTASFFDLAAMYEFNFMPYQTANRRTKYSLYMAGGAGYHFVLLSDTETENHFTIPFSLGFKFNAGKRLSAGFEWSPRKTFSDMVDGTKNFHFEDQEFLLGNKDWYNFAGIFVSYKIFNYRDDCPTYE